MDMKITYTQQGNYLIPDLAVPEEEEVTLNRYGELIMKYYRERDKAKGYLMMMSGELNEFVRVHQEKYMDMEEELENEMARKEGITEEMKSTDQMSWVRAMNNISARAREIVMKQMYSEL
jgi:hypothetical protein